MEEPLTATRVGEPPPRLEYCAKQRSDDWCDKCEQGRAQHFGRCVAHCPEEGYFLGRANRADACRKCYYSCKTCSGPNDYEVRGCKLFLKKPFRCFGYSIAVFSVFCFGERKCLCENNLTILLRIFNRRVSMLSNCFVTCGRRPAGLLVTLVVVVVVVGGGGE